MRVNSCAARVNVCTLDEFASRGTVDMAYGRSTRAATPLQAARLELGWKSSQTIQALQEAAAAAGTTVATASSLKTMLSRWENGHDEVREPLYRRLFCQIYCQTPEELGLSRSDADARASARIAPPVGSEMVQYFQNVFLEHLRADNLMGPNHLVDVVRAQAALLDQMLPVARGDVRTELVILALRYNEFAGWLYQDACSAEQAMIFTDRAMDYALEIDRPRETSYVLMRKADIAADLDKPDRVIGLTDAALRRSSNLAPRSKALVLRLQGRAHARLGDGGECSRALDTAREQVELAHQPDGLTDYCTSGYIGMEAANCWRTLGQFDKAVAAYEESLESWPDELRRDQGLCLARLSVAHAGREDIRSACTQGRRAIDVVRAAPSGRALNELQHLRVQLAPWRRDAEVSDLSDRIRSLFRPAA
jgi:tetratricopeptide (TPR) repeat protein